MSGCRQVAISTPQSLVPCAELHVRPAELEDRLGIRFERGYEAGLGPTLIARIAFPSGVQFTLRQLELPPETDLALFLPAEDLPRLAEHLNELLGCMGLASSDLSWVTPYTLQ